jgi:hypothetical protein
VNDPPVAAADSYSTQEDVALVVASPGVLANDSDIDAGDGRSAVLVSGPSNGALTLNADGGFTYVPNANYYGPDSFTYQARDTAGALSGAVVVTLGVTSVNDPPSSLVASMQPAVVNENGTATLSGSFADPDTGDTHTVTISWGDGGPDTVLSLAPGARAFSAAHLFRDDRPSGADAFQVRVTIRDSAGAEAAVETVVTVNNVAPVITSVSGPAGVVELGTPVTISATYTDAGVADSHQCTFAWGDGTPVTQVLGAGGACSATHAFAASSVYEVRVTIADDDGASVTDAYRYVVVYDAAAGFVTGGGWITSPAGAYAPNAALTGKATFGFVSKYKSGSSVPTGNTEFQFKAADLSFRSTSYEWMVISGAKVRYRGVGQVNGAGTFGFELTAWDGQEPGGGGVDRFRLQVWDSNRGNAMLYDNQMGAEQGAEPTTAIGGGSIVIHK